MSRQTPSASLSPLTILRDVRFLRIVVQAVVLLVVIALLNWLVTNTADGLRRAGIPTDFSFLNQVSGFQIDEGFVDQPHTRSGTYLNAFIVGLGNTLRVIFFSLIFATALGLVMGVARLSTNWLIRNIAVVYIEVMQNTPLLLQLFFIYSGVFLTLPAVRQAIELPGPSYLSVRGLAMPGLRSTETTWPWLIITLISGIVGTLVWKALRRRRINTGQTTYAAEIGLGIMILTGGLSWILLTPFTVSLPRIQGFGYVRGEGAIVSPEFVALVVGLTLYTGAYIAECVRSGIQAVPPGQWEAARAQGFTYLQTLRLIVLPQALRVIIPPLTNQYLNLSKNSTLGAAVGFFDLFGVARTTQQSVPVIPVVTIVMATYLIVSLVIAFVMNVLNARVQIRVR